MSNVITTSRREGFNILNNTTRSHTEVLAHPAVNIAKQFHDAVSAKGYGHEFGVQVKCEHIQSYHEDYPDFDDIEIEVYFNYDKSNSGAICRDAKNLYRKFRRATGQRLTWDGPNASELWVDAPDRRLIFKEAEVSWNGSIDRSDYLIKYFDDNPRGKQLQLFPDDKKLICSAREITVWCPWDVDAE